MFPHMIGEEIKNKKVLSVVEMFEFKDLATKKIRKISKFLHYSKKVYYFHFFPKYTYFLFFRFPKWPILSYNHPL